MIGVASALVVVVAVQPGTGRTETEAIGWSTGMSTSMAVVEALASSFGTRNETLA